MYTGSADFITANNKPIQKHRITGSVDTVPFTSAHILTGSLTLTNQCSDSTDSKIGAVFIGKLTCTFLKNLSIVPSTWKGRKITLNFSLCIDEDADTWESFPLGEFFVSEANIVPDGVSITAYDAMSKFDVLLPSAFIASGQAVDILKAVCEACGVSFGMTDIQVASLPNGTRPLGLYTPNDCTTYRDILYWLSQALGGFATIARNGKLVIRSYYNIAEPTETIDDTQRVTGASFSDFGTDFGSAVFDNEDGTSERIGAQGVGATYFVGFNPFLQYGTPEARAILRTNVFLSVQTMRYTPFKVSLMSAPIYELGDPLIFSGGIVSGNNKTGVVQSMTWRASQGVSIAGFGADPALQDVKSESERANSAANRAQQNSEIIYKDYANLTPISVVGGADPVKVVEINFTTAKKTDVEMWHEIQVLPDLRDPACEVTAIYYLDGVEMSRKPVETFTDEGKHLLDLHYFRNIEEVGGHRWEVFLETSGGDLAIDSQGAIAVLKGQGLSKVDAWTGVIVLDDTIEAFFMGMHSATITASVVVSVRALDYDLEFSDTINGPAMGMGFGQITDVITFAFYQPTFALVTEDAEYNIVTEDGDYNICTG